MFARVAATLTTSQSTFGVIPSPQIRPDLFIARKTAPCVMPAAVVHMSIVALTQLGDGPRPRLPDVVAPNLERRELA